MSHGLPLLVLSLVLAVPAHSEVSSTNQPFSGIAEFSETRAQPPTRLFVAEVDLSNPKVRLRVAPGGPDPDGPGQWQTTLMQPTRIAAREKMVLVVNGDFFRARGVKDAEGTNSAFRASQWSSVRGPAVTEGKAWSTGASNQPCLVVRKDGQAAIKMMLHASADDWEVVAGNTMLVENGVIVPHQNKVRHPRTALGLDAKGTKLILLVVDGRKPGVAIGMSYDELAADLIRLGCRQALNLDGGGSSVMALRNAEGSDYRILNEPTDGRERAVANALGVIVQK
jgi:exopolysaccharide biosynthesis protein